MAAARRHLARFKAAGASREASRSASREASRDASRDASRGQSRGASRSGRESPDGWHRSRSPRGRAASAHLPYISRGSPGSDGAPKPREM